MVEHQAENKEKDAYQWQVLNARRTPEDLIYLEMDTALENVFQGLMIVGFIAVGICILLFFTNQGLIRWEYLVLCMIGFLFVAGVSASLRKGTDNYIIIDPVQRKVFYRFKLSSFETKTVIADFKDILAVSTDCKTFQGKYRKVHEYACVIFTRSRKKIVLSPWSQKHVAAYNDDAQELARLMAVGFVEGQEELVIDYSGKPDEPKLVLRPANFVEGMTPLHWFFAVWFSLLGLFMAYTLISSFIHQWISN